MLSLLSTVCVFWLDMIPRIIEMYIVTFDSNEYQGTAIFLFRVGGPLVSKTKDLVLTSLLPPALVV